MHYGQVRHNGIIHVLPEQRLAAEAVEGDAVRDLDRVELLLLGQDLIDVGLDAGIGVEDFLADGALGGGLDFGFGAGGEAGKGEILGAALWVRWSDTY